MYVIGITGGVGSGKSEAVRILAEISNAQCLIADEIGHLVMEPGTMVYKKITEVFGTEILNADKTINRAVLSNIVFAQKEKLRCLNEIVHPGVLQYMKDYIWQREREEGYILLESAILFESGCDRLCQEVWYIHAPYTTRVERLSKSRGYSVEKSRGIMEKQQKDEVFFKSCDRTIENGGTTEQLEENLRQAFLQCTICSQGESAAGAD